MTCRQVDEHLDGAGRLRPAPEAIRSHLRACSRCQTLYEPLRAPETPAVAVAVTAQLTRSLRPVKPVVSPLRFVVQLMASLLGVVLLAVAVMGGVAGAGLTIPIVVAGVVLAAGAGLLAVSLAWQRIPGSLHTFRPGVAMGALLVSFVLVCFLVFPVRPAPGGFLLPGLECLRSGLLMAVPVVVLACWLFRRGAALNWPVLGATLGSVAGATVVLILQMRCPKNEALHLAVWHGGVIGVSLAGGLAAGWLLTRLRRFPG